MKIKAKTAVTVHYTLKNDDGNVMDTSTHTKPFEYLQGANNLVPGLEREMEGREVGDAFAVSIGPAEGFGEYNPSLVQKSPKSMFDGVEKIEVGMPFQTQTENGPRVVMVKSIDDEHVVTDGNHPLAGQNLHYEIEIIDIRAATQEEINQGYVTPYAKK